MSSGILPIFIFILLPIMQVEEIKQQPDPIVILDPATSYSQDITLNDLVDVEQAIKSGYILRDEDGKLILGDSCLSIPIGK